jgi:hypothetical protein
MDTSKKSDLDTHSHTKVRVVMGGFATHYDDESR